MPLCFQRRHQNHLYHPYNGCYHKDLSLIHILNENKDKLHDDPIYIEGIKDTNIVEVALQYCDTYTENLFTFVNNINTEEGGTHLSGFKQAMTRTINDYARKIGALKDGEENLSGDDVREGMTAVISIKIQEPQFEGQTKTCLLYTSYP